MNNLDLKQYGVQEMNTIEMNETKGGFALAIVIIAAIGAAIGGYIYGKKAAGE